ncbi:hypothetical protein [Rossellomorea sp. BNER]|uniref:hypothetical protein n=1 Tax=Rossellomorea sp. BNER TaxID=2962031 RepID=UPI003AF29A24|nr:hypothetical protein [Rossellomorea sp. BNER]
MGKGLDKQISIYSLDTASFYNEKEYKLHTEIEALKLELYLIKELLKLSGKDKTKKITEITKKNKNNPKLINKVITSVEEIITHEQSVNLIKGELASVKEQKKALRAKNTELRKSKKGKSKDEKVKIDEIINHNKHEIEFCKVFATLFQAELKGMKSPKKILNDLIELKKDKLKKLFDKNSKIRTLREDTLIINNAVSVFDSVLTRTIGCSNDEGICTDIIIVQSYYYKVLESLITKGFINADGDQWIYYSSSAGQIRKKRGVWIKKALWDKYENSLMCGLTEKKINEKDGINLTKFQAYKALTNSASVKWEDGFDIRRCVVVDDLTVTINTNVDYINRDTYEIKPNEPMDIEIEVTDGCGIMRPSVSDKSFMCRLPFVKGLLVPFPIDKFLEEHPDANATITDIYNKEHDIKDVDIIFTRSQFKLYSYYNDWEEYQDLFEEHECEAAKLNEEDTSGEATLTYQMLQTLVMEDEELEEIASATTKDIEGLGRDLETTLRIMGVSEDKDNKRMNYFQQALKLYPNLLNDKHTKEAIRKKKRSLISSAKSGKLRIDSAKYTFIVPDLYAFAQKIFGLEVTGLLEDGQVHCRLYNEGEICTLRSPHLHREWGVRDNTKTEQMKDWYITDGIYVSIHDALCKMLQFDQDGDKSLVLQMDKVVEVSERNMRNDNILPLYYKMAKADPDKINPKNLYSSLIEAYKATVGVVSNQISKCWNYSEGVDEEVLDVIRWLCMESNFQIDRSKTNFMTTRPNHVDEIIKKYTNLKTPFFFQFAKNKEESKVEPKNNSTMNRLISIIDKHNKRMYFAKIADKFDYKQLLKNKRIKTDDEVAQEIIDKYEEFSENIKLMMNEKAKDDLESGDVLPVHKFIRKELLKIKNNAHYVADVLVKYLYAEKNSPFKTILWSSFGKEIVRNIKKNVHGIVECKSCRCSIDNPKKNQVRCEGCQKKRENEKSKLGMQKLRLMTSA